MVYLIFGNESLFITDLANKNRSLQISYSNSIRQVQSTFPVNKTKFQCLIGLKYIKSTAVLIVVTEANQITMLGSSGVFEIKKIDFVAIAPQNQQYTLLAQYQQQLNQIRSIFDIGFHYFSRDYDLSLPYIQNKVKVVEQTQRGYYNQFIWNLVLTRMDGQQNAQTNVFQKWCVKVIQGYIDEFKSQLPHEKFRYILISRRSFKKAGTRFYARGIDDKGHVANYVQTQQIIYLGNYIFTHLQIRGSVPAFFAQVGVNGIACDMVIQRTIPLTRNAFHLHFSKIKQMYNRVLAVNLLSQKKSQQLLLSNFYESIVSSEASIMPYVRYQFYDFHEECKNNKFENSQALIEKLQGVIEAFGYNCFDIQSTKIVRQQNGVFRTNCLDCLDRTNYIQSRIALKIVKHFMQRFSNEQIHTLCKDKKLLDFPVNQDFPILRGFNHLWAQNGDAISTLYTGIGSTHTDITRTGQRTLLGAFNHKFRSLMRFYIQFNDHVKHQAMNKLVTPSLQRSKHSHKNDFHTTLLFSIDNELPIQEAIQKIRGYIFKAKPTIIVFFVLQKKKLNFFQKLKCMASNQTTDFQVWQKLVSERIQKSQYHKIGSLMGQLSWMSVFCSESAVSQVGEVKQQNLSSQLSISRDVLVLKMKLYASSFVFACVNIPTFEQYLTLFDQIHQKAFQTSKLGVFRSSSFLSLDYKVIIGNTGSKVNIPQKELCMLQTRLDDSKHRKNEHQFNKTLGQVLDHDQLSNESFRYQNRYLRQYTQGPLYFIPRSNRMVFWNEENVVLKVKDYQQAGNGCIVGVLEYEVGISNRSSLTSRLQQEQ